MARRLVTVSDTGQLPPEVLAKIGETYVSRVEGAILVDNRVQFAIDNLASETPGAYKIPRYDENGMFAINDGVEPEHPVNLGQLDERVPAGGVPLATQLQNGLMSISDKTKLDSTLPRKPFPWGAKLSTLETGVVYYHNIIGYPANVNLSELPGILTEYRDNHGQAHTFEITANEIVTASSKIRSYMFNSHSLRVMYGADTGSISPATPWPDLTTASWKPLYISISQASLLDGATNQSTADVLVKRDSTGRFEVLAPTASSHPVPKSYADNASNLTTGTVPAARLPLATASVNGAMSAAHYALLNGATNLPTASTVVRRDSAGRHQVSDPSVATDATNKGYVDGKKWDGADITTGAIAPERIANATNLLDGLMSKADKAKLDKATDNASVDTLMMRDSSGNVRVRVVLSDVAQSAMVNALTRKDYVDTQASNASNLTTGTVSPERIANATSALDGLMPKADKAKLDAATSNATASTIAMRDSAGAVNVGQPTAVGHATRKDYVDTQASNASNLTTGTVSPERIANATSALDGLMPKTDKAKLDAATTNSTANTLAMRDANGMLAIQTPTGPTHAANKSYVDAQASNASNLSTGTVAPERIANATNVLDGLMSKADKAKLDASTPSSTAGAMVIRDSAGRFQVPAPSTNSTDVVNKSYVDGKTWDGSDITTGTVNPARIANATSSLNGLMSSADKAKLDGATASNTPNTIVTRASNGRTNLGSIAIANAPTSIDDATRKDYVDGLIAQQVSLAGELGSADLNTIITPGDYYASGGTNAVVANNYPADGSVGTLSVRRFHASNVWVTQTLTVWSRNEVWVRSANSSTGWTAWKLQATTDYVDGKTWSGSDITTGTINPARIANATSSLDGLMAKADKAKLDGASSASTANTIMMTDSAGRFNVATPSASTNAANKSYVDGKTWDGSDITTGTINQARIANATTSLNGLMSSTDKAKLDAATLNSTANTIAMRDSNGMLATQTPTGPTHATNKSYVDGLIARQVSMAGTLGTGSINGIVTPGEYHQGSATYVTTANGYPYNGSSGALKVVPYATSETTYIIQYWTSAGDERTFFRSTANGGTSWRSWVEMATSNNIKTLLTGDLSMDRLRLSSTSDASETSTGHAFQIGEDTTNNLIVDNNEIIGRNNGVLTPIGMPGGIQSLPDPTTPTQAARKSYVDAQVASVLTATSIGTAQDLNNYTTQGNYYQSTNAGASGGTNYPSALAGRLEVVNASSFVYQTYTEYSSTGRQYYRTKQNTTWFPWKEITTTLTATADTMGNLPTITAATLSGNLDTYTTPGTYIVGGNVSNDGGLLEVFVASNGDICQRKVLQNSLNGSKYQTRWYNIRSAETTRSWSSWSS